MNAAERRDAIEKYLSQAEKPVSATALAERLGVSRQIIVGDVALLRAGGLEVSATPRGYLLRRTEGYLGTVVCIHGSDKMEAELLAAVDNGCRVEDVVVEHPIYGELTGHLSVESRYDVSRFVEQVSKNDAPPLSSLTGGIHLHHLSCPHQEAFERVCRQLETLGVLYHGET